MPSPVRCVPGIYAGTLPECSCGLALPFARRCATRFSVAACVLQGQRRRRSQITVPTICGSRCHKRPMCTAEIRSPSAPVNQAYLSFLTGWQRLANNIFSSKHVGRVVEEGKCFTLQCLDNLYPSTSSLLGAAVFVSVSVRRQEPRKLFFSGREVIGVGFIVFVSLCF